MESQDSGDDKPELSSVQDLALVTGELSSSSSEIEVRSSRDVTDRGLLVRDVTCEKGSPEPAKFKVSPPSVGSPEPANPKVSPPSVGSPGPANPKVSPPSVGSPEPAGPEVSPPIGGSPESAIPKGSSNPRP